MFMSSTIYLIPIPLAEEGDHALPAQTTAVINSCDVFFAENLRTARRAFRKMDRQFDIDAKEWHETGKAEEEKTGAFIRCIREGKTIGIVSESGCPGIADPGQQLIAAAHREKAKIVPLTGPNSMLLALMASGMNGQHFTFNGYLPIPTQEREKKIKELEKKACHENCTQLFIETPYRNNQLLQAIVNACQPLTRLCVAVDLTSTREWISTMTIADWKKSTIELPKSPAIFILGKNEY